MEKSIPDLNFAAKMNPFPKSKTLWYASSSLVSQQRLRALLDPHMFSWTSDQGSSVNKTKGKIELKGEFIDFKMTQVMSQTKYFVWILTNKLKPYQTKHLRNNWGRLNSNRTFSNIKETLRTMVNFFQSENGIVMF